MPNYTGRQVNKKRQIWGCFGIVANVLFCSTLSRMTETILPSESQIVIPVIGRETLYARLQQYVLDPPNRHAFLFTGHDGVGKSRLLQHFPQVFDNQILAIYVPLDKAPLTSTDEWLHHLLDCTNEMLEAHEFTLSRVPQEADENLTFADWFCDVYLYEVMHMIRPQRRIAWLLDDAEYLLKALPEQITYLHRLLQTHLQLAIIMTLDTEHEAQMPELVPLVNISAAERLHRLTKTDSAELLRHYAPGASDEVVNAVYEATGGHPLLLNNFGRELHTTWASHSDNQALQAARPTAYAASEPHFRHLWQLLSQDERLVLTAIASLIYDDPLKTVTAEHIEAWLVETDYPKDIVAIHAALRGLDYQDIVSNYRNEGFKLIAGMMQTWLLEHARLTDAVDGSGFKVKLSWRIVVLVGVVIVLLIVLLFALPSPTLNPSDAIPTVTLAQ
jgi:hypothetical protein